MSESCPFGIENTLKIFKIESKNAKKEHLTFFLFVRGDYFLGYLCLATGTTLADAWQKIWPERIFGNGDINDKEEFSGFHISREKAAIYELSEHAKPENALSVKKREFDDWLSSDENASTTNNFMG